MIDHGKQNVLGVRIDAVDYDAAVAKTVDAAHAGRPLAVSALAVHGLMTGALDRTHRHRLNQLDLVVPDGQPVRWALNGLHKTQLTDRVYGPQLMLEVCRRAAEENLSVFLFGGSEALLGDLQEQLQRSVPGMKLAGTRASKFRSLSSDERDELVAEIRGSGARIVLVGLGCPRQEVFVYELRDALQMPMLAVGAAFNFHAGHLDQAPLVLQRLGLEWAFRLMKEPRRLWRRYLLLNPLYLSLLALQVSGVYSIDPDNTQPPQQEICYG